MEIIILMICPLPFFDTVVKFDYFIFDKNIHTIEAQLLSDYVLAFMFLRLYFLFRSYFNYSIYTDAYSKRLCKEYGLYPGFRFIFKSKFVTEPATMILTLFIITIFVISYVLRIFELRYALNPDTSTH